jgi:rod shape-determining protein MreB
MLSAVLGLFSQDVAVDLGTSNTRVFVRGSGVVCHEPTVVAVHTSGRGRRRVVAVGHEALPMVGRTPPDVQTVQPVRDGQIADFEVAEALLLHLVRRAHGRNGWISPRMVVAVPHAASEMERRAVRESCEGAGARHVHVVSRPIAAALGADLPVDEPSGHLLVDIGGGATEISVVSMRGVVASVSVQGGGEAMDEAIAAWLRREHGLLVGRGTAERIKHELGVAVRPEAADPSASRMVAGRCLSLGIPRAVRVSPVEVYAALAPNIAEIVEAMRRVLDHTPAELAADIVDHGAVLIGGGSRLRRLDEALREATGLPVVCADSDGGTVARGAGRLLEQTELLRAVAS